ncbi:DUF58 domain-containing protein [bacterium]|nr:DUF58 domain-containing protein [Rhodopirellula sp.]MDA7878182.1 DUF58 domain-containing protein [bacterium]
MDSLHDLRKGKSWAARVLTTDFCPSANRFVYWLKEPVGWFVLATFASVIIGLYFAPIGWTLAAALASVIAVGMIWPAVAVRAVTCSLRPKKPQVHEDDPCELQFSVRNLLPMPLWGLSVEGFLDRSCKYVDTEKLPTVALAFIRALTTSTYRFSIQPDFRGCYPDGDAMLTCSFPFGIWTAKRKLEDITPITVWPKVYPISGQALLKGRNTAELGEGERSGRTGNFIGIRDYRNGDSLREVNWIATARYGDLVVTERSAPQSCNVEVIVDVGAFEHREPLANRIRVAASILANLHHPTVSLTVRIGKQVIHVMRGRNGFVQMMDALARVPAEGLGEQHPQAPLQNRLSVTISSNQNGDIVVCAADPDANRRLSQDHMHRVIAADQELASQLLLLWPEVRDANLVA